MGMQGGRWTAIVLRIADLRFGRFLRRVVLLIRVDRRRSIYGLFLRRTGTVRLRHYIPGILLLW